MPQTLANSNNCPPPPGKLFLIRACTFCSFCSMVILFFTFRAKAKVLWAYKLFSNKVIIIKINSNSCYE